MVDIPGFVVRGAIRSKKTSQRIITIPKKGAHRCHCGHLPGFPKIIPSEAHEEWHGCALRQCFAVKRLLSVAGVELPITDKINMEALFFQDVNRSDCTGLYESIADLLQDAQIISNDKIIESWDGSRRLKDAVNPRVEIYISILEEIPVQESLLAREKV